MLVQNGDRDSLFSFILPENQPRCGLCYSDFDPSLAQNLMKVVFTLTLILDQIAESWFCPESDLGRWWCQTFWSKRWFWPEHHNGLKSNDLDNLLLAQNLCWAQTLSVAQNLMWSKPRSYYKVLVQPTIKFKFLVQNLIYLEIWYSKKILNDDDNPLLARNLIFAQISYWIWYCKTACGLSSRCWP